MRTMRAAVAALALVGVVAGCGRGDGTEEVAVVRELDVLQGVESAGSARIALEMDLETPIAHVVGRAEGVVAYPAGDVALTAVISTGTDLPEDAVDEVLPPTPFHQEIRRRGDEGWHRTWVEGDEPGAWQATQLFRGVDEAWSAAGPLPIDPAALLDRLREEARSFTEVGREEVRGDATTRYRARIDRAAFEEGLGLWSDGTEDEVTIDVWVDDDDRLRRLEAGGLTLELWDFGVPVEVEVPTDIDEDGAFEDLDRMFPQLAGEWAEQSAGTTAGVGWSVFSAEGRVRDTATTCRTFETTEGVHLPGLGELAEMAGREGLDLPVPVHGDALATCGSGFLSTSLGRFVPDPAVQVLTPMAFDGPPLVAFVVAPRFAEGGIRLIRDGAEPVDLVPDAAGVAVWDGSGSPAVTSVELDGGAVSCGLASLGGLGDGTGLVPEEAIMGALGPGPDPCVRA